MSESDKSKVSPETELLASSASSPLVFISHDARDAEFAEAFSKLLKSISAGMIKTFRSSDKKGTEGIDFGEEWYKRLMAQLQLWAGGQHRACATVLVARRRTIR